ncbi:MAG: hypothetical protein ACAI44_08300 [Candidatus Sericytochromatia bacterium]
MRPTKADGRPFQVDGQTLVVRTPTVAKGKMSLQDKQRKLWKKFRRDPRLWIEHCLKVVDVTGNEVPFQFNNVQDIYYQILIDLYWKPYKTLASGEILYRLQGVREINLKARQFGLSTLICALLLHDTLFFRNTKTYIFCQDAPKSKEMLRDKIKYFWENITPSRLLVLPKTEVYNETIVKFAGINSQIQAHTPGSSEGTARKKGRSITLRNGLLSEMAEWEDAETLWQGLAPAIRDKTTNCFIESSPYTKKSGPFFRGLYEEGKLPESIWNSRFWPWFLYEKYATPFDSAAHLDAFRATITDEELVLRELYQLTDEQLLWRRETISLLGGGARGAEKFRHDFPSNETEGFESSDEELFFRDSDVDLRQLLAQAQDPVEGRMYATTVDVAKGTGGDFATIKVADPTTRATVFSWSSRYFSIRRLHRKLYEIWCRYPGPVAIENNGIGETVVALARLITDEFFQKMLYWSARGQDGFCTGSQKEQMLYDLRDQLEMAVKAYAGLGPDDPLPSLPIGYRLALGADDQVLVEMDHFLDLGDGKYGARSGQHDDHIMALAIMITFLRTVPTYQRRFNKYYPKREQYRVASGSLDDDDDPSEGDD